MSPDTISSAPAAHAPAYARLAARFARIGTLNECGAILHWDASVTMPPGGAPARGEHMAALAGLAHEMLVAPDASELLDAAEAEAAAGRLDPWQARNLALMRHQWRHASALPADLVEAQARAHAACEAAWRVARPASDFAAVRPLLAEVVRLQGEAAAARGAALGIAPYDALLDSFERGVTEAMIGPIFARYQEFLAEALPAILERQASAPAPLPLPGPFPVAAQEAFVRALVAGMGFDFDHGRLDISAHPFCGGIPSDVRITTRYDEADIAQALMGVLHETGHALYERGLPAAWARQPVGAAAGMAAHESQSLIVEMQASRSDAFLSWLGPRLHASFGGAAEPYAPANLARAWRRVAPGFIRVDADEVTYPAHIILRYRLERALIAGELAVADLPGAWNEGFRALLGLAVPDDRRGCLQDIHWYDGAFGYFPSYTLGAMAAAQMFAAATAAVPEIVPALGRGEFAPLIGWLRAHVHARGSREDLQGMLKQATGAPLDPARFIAHLRQRYLGGA
ncbi:MAG: carboxypeptidase M32 [Alphaproteobacteria bacterium]|nr:carboxypeptidase M32 [Alphaproteobacteria bacterium]